MTTLSAPQVYGDPPVAAPSIIAVSSTSEPSAATSSAAYTTYGVYTPAAPTTIAAASTTPESAADTAASTLPASTASASTAPAFDYTQILNKAIRGYSTTEINNAPFPELCPDGDCFQACQNFSLMLNSDRYDYDPTAELPTSFSTTDVTLFGLCTNIANITSAVADTDSLPKAAAFFNAQTHSQYDVNKVVSGTAQCLLGTCLATRKPGECESLCSPFVIQESISTFNFVNTYECITKLCDNTCGLPYANQDVFGVGVLSSCAIQYFIILLYAIFCIIRMPRHNSYIAISTTSKASQKSNSRTDKVAERINTAAGAFLVAQCFFAVSTAVAAFRLAPWSIDPLNGYALLFIASIGFIPPVFTLMLLRSQKRREWYHIFVVLLSWVLSTALFFILIGNLQDVRHDSQRVAQARNALFPVDACGGYSAMSLCTETGKSDPINYMMGFFNYDTVPNLDNIWVVWLFPFLVLLALSIHRFFPRFMTRALTRTKGKFKSTFSRRYVNTVDNVRRPLLILGIVLFILCFLYQVFLIKKYVEMDLIDTRRKTGWTFGQIVAVLLWAPFIFELTIGWFLEWRQERREEKRLHQSQGLSGQSTTTQGSTHSMTYHSMPSATGHTPLMASMPTPSSTPHLVNQGFTSPAGSGSNTPVTTSIPIPGSQPPISPVMTNQTAYTVPSRPHSSNQPPVSPITSPLIPSTTPSSPRVINRRPVSANYAFRP